MEFIKNEIKTVNQGKVFINELRKNDLTFHFDDGAEVLFELNLINEQQKEIINERLDELFNQSFDWGEYSDPFGYALVDWKINSGKTMYVTPKNLRVVRKKINLKDAVPDPKRYFEVEFTCDNFKVANLVQDIVSKLEYEVYSDAIVIKCSQCFEEISSIDDVCEDCDELFEEDNNE